MDPSETKSQEHDKPASDFEEDAIIIGRDDTRDFNPYHILPQPTAVLDQLQQWLGSTEYDGEGSEYQKHRSLHLPGTGDWVLAAPVYQQWYNGQGNGMLWIRGAPGSGKSVLAANLVQKLSDEGSPVLYFFFRHTIAANHGWQGALRDWLAQILAFSPPLQQDLLNLVKNETNVDQLSLPEMFQLLRTALSCLPKAYCIVDALDEMDRSALEPFLKQLDDLGKWRPREVKLIMTSRPVAVVEKTVRGVKVLDVRLDRQHVEADIATYLSHRLASSSIPKESYALVTETVLGQCEGLFIFAKLALDTLAERPSRGLHDSIRTLPANLSVVYSNLLEEQSTWPEIPKGLQQVVLECVTHATRPLRLLEIADLIHVTQQGSQDLGATKDLVRSICGPLLEILPDETVHVVHHSLTEFLNGTARGSSTGSSYPVFEFGPTHNLMALRCLTYLQSGCLDNIRLGPSIPLEYSVHGGGWGRPLEPNQVLPSFTQYAALNWYRHAQMAEGAGHDQSEVNRKFIELAVGESLERLVSMANIGRFWGLGSSGFTPLCFATACRLKSLAKFTLTLPELANAEGQESKNVSIRYAAAKGLTHFVQLLLEHDADFSTYDQLGDSALHLATHMNHPETAAVLLDAGADPFIPQGDSKLQSDCGGDAELGCGICHSLAKSRQDRCPAFVAFTHADPTIASIFLSHLKTSEAANLALSYALRATPRPDLVRLILKHPMVKVNVKVSGSTPLYRACQYRDAATIALLLEAGADPNILHEEDLPRRNEQIGCNVLHALSRASRRLIRDVNWQVKSEVETRRCFRLVLDAGAKLEQVDRMNGTPLHEASDAAAVRCLLDAGLDPNIMNKCGVTLLHTTDDESIIRSLAPRTDINLRETGHGYSPLLYTLAEKNISSQDRIQKVYLLLELGADISTSDQCGNGLLHHAFRVRNFLHMSNIGPYFIEHLLAYGIDVNFRNHGGQTSLHSMGSAMVQWQSPVYNQILDILLGAGANLEVKDNMGRTPILHMASSSRNEYQSDKACYEKLVACGARIDTVDSAGRNLLHYVVSEERTGLFKYFVSLGLDPLQTDYEGNTLWHALAPSLATRVGKVNMTSELISMGVDPTKRNNRGQTPLHIIASFQPAGIYPYSRNSRSSPGVDNSTGFDKFISFCQDVDRADEDGITPLHIASTLSEYLTRRLLEAGANPSQTSAEGWTLLHTASRSRQPGIVGMILAWLRTKLDLREDLEFINRSDKLGRSALYYACASGMPETVQLLLEGGALVSTSLYATSSWHGCVAFQEEINSADWSRQHDRYAKNPESDAGGVLIADTVRPLRSPVTKFGPVERLDEILEMLMAYGSESGIRYIDEAIASAADKEFDYTVACLLRTRDALDMPGAYETNVAVARCLDRRQITVSSIPKEDKKLFATRLLAYREYELATVNITELVESQFKAQQLKGHTLLHHLAENGFARLLDQTARPEIVQSLGIPDNKDTIPLLAVACQRKVPNMEVVRVLVEKKGAPLDASALKLAEFANSKTGPTALHIVAQGHTWWQINEALPYLLSRGANPGIVAHYDATPLHLALKRIGRSSFSPKAVDVLLKFGADPSALDFDGTSCLFQARNNYEIRQLLLRHVVTITPSAMIDIIRHRDISLLERVLAGGADPNMRGHSPRHGKSSWILDLYPIDFLLSCANWDSSDEDLVLLEKMLDLLLVHGANLSASYENTTVMHRVFLREGVTSFHKDEHPFLRKLLRHPSVNLEARCGAREDMTILLLACDRITFSAESDPKGTSRAFLLHVLLDLGANIYAKDRLGRGVLHHLMMRTQHGRFRHLKHIWHLEIQRVLQDVPDLLHAVDDKGMAAIHATLEPQDKVYPHLHPENHQEESLGVLLAAGADAAARVCSTGDTALHFLFGGIWLIRSDGATQFGCRPYAESDESEPSMGLLGRLLTGGADINGSNNERETPMFNFIRSAEICGSMEGNSTARVLAPGDFDRGSSPAKAQWFIDREQFVWELLDKLGVDWKAVNGKKETLLHVVAEDVRTGKEASFRRVGRFKFLMGKGLDPWYEDEEHRTALDVAAALGNEDIQQLFKSG